MNFSGGMNATGTPDISLPYVITADNTTAGTLTDVVILNPVLGLGTTNNGCNAGVTMTYDVTGWTFLAFNYMLLNLNVYIQELYIECSTQAQLTKNITVEFQDPNGDKRTTTIVPRIKEANNQTTIVTAKCGFWLNGTTKITLASLQTTNAVTISMYPAIVGNPIGTIKGTGGATVLADPNISMTSVKMVQ
ncbi:MAG: hypothetical protein WCT77_00165 [Bacteroidota bacterium]